MGDEEGGREGEGEGRGFYLLREGEGGEDVSPTVPCSPRTNRYSFGCREEILMSSVTRCPRGAMSTPPCTLGLARSALMQKLGWRTAFGLDEMALDVPLLAMMRVQA